MDGGLEQLNVVEMGGGATALHIGRKTVDELSAPEITFFLSRMVARLRLRHMLYRRLDPETLGRVVAAILSVLCHSFLSPYPPEELEDLRMKLEKHLAKRIRRQLEPLSLELSYRPIEPVRWLAAMEQSEDRIALAVCGDLQAALTCILRTDSRQPQTELTTPAAFAAAAGPRTQHLMSFAMSEEYLTLRERLGQALQE